MHAEYMHPPLDARIQTGYTKLTFISFLELTSVARPGSERLPDTTSERRIRPECIRDTVSHAGCSQDTVTIQSRSTLKDAINNSVRIQSGGMHSRCNLDTDCTGRIQSGYVSCCILTYPAYVICILEVDTYPTEGEGSRCGYIYRVVL